jgi:hypothetical protein
MLPHPPTMVQVTVADEAVCLGYSAALANSCVSVAFWESHQVLSKEFCPTVVYSVTAPTQDFLWTTAVEFYVCDDMEFDIVLGQDFDRCCHESLGVSFIPHFFTGQY